MDNRGLAAECYKQALHFDVYCFEAFESLVKYQMLTAAEGKGSLDIFIYLTYPLILEIELLKSLPIMEQCTPEESQILLTLYESKLKKYHTPLTSTNQMMFGEPLLAQNYNLSDGLVKLVQAPHTPLSMVTPMSISTPNITKNNDRNIQKAEGKKSKNQDDNQKMQIEYIENAVVTKLKSNIDLQVAEAERLYYNCDYQQCSQFTEALLKEDPYHDICLSVHISCHVELKQSNSKYCFIGIHKVL